MFKKINSIVFGNDLSSPLVDLFDQETRKNMASNIIDIPSDREIFNIKNWDGITNRCLIPHIKKEVDNKVETYYAINIADAMKKLTLVGKLLQLAYSGSRGFQCNVSIIKVLDRYQNLIKDSVVTCSTFVEVIIKALSYNKMAIVMAEKDNCKKGLEFLVKCEKMAERMEEESEKLFQAAEVLCNLSSHALIKATSDQATSEGQNSEIIEAARRFEAEQIYMETMTQELEGHVEQLIEEEARHNKAAKVHTVIGYVTQLPVISYFTGNISDKSDEISMEEKRKESEANKKRHELLKEKRNTNAELAKLVKQFQNANVQKNDLEQSIYALQITEKTMGQIKTVFSDVKKFWVSVKNHCHSLNDTTALAEEFTNDTELFIAEVRRFGYSWLALGKINLEAAKSMRSVESEVDSIMTNLPSKEESIKLAQELAYSILISIEVDNKMITDRETADEYLLKCLEM